LAETFKSLKEVLFMLSIPRTLALAAGQISLLSLVAMASFFAPGSIAVFMFAFNPSSSAAHYHLCFLFCRRISNARAFHGERPEKKNFWNILGRAPAHSFFGPVPAFVLVMFCARKLVRVILGSGAFELGCNETYRCTLSLFIISLVAQSMTLLLARRTTRLEKKQKFRS